MMGIYHVCDICGKKLEENEEKRYFVKIGTQMKLREINQDYMGLRKPYLDIDCCENCAKAVQMTIKGIKGRVYPSGYCPTCYQELSGDTND